ncbi:hypothetical protein OFB62_33545, partial [Escherichia coli]|nr:hypothetical protein [Escherichia coli]
MAFDEEAPTSPQLSPQRFVRDRARERTAETLSIIRTNQHAALAYLVRLAAKLQVLCAAEKIADATNGRRHHR